jgi:hypothetical protein
MTTDRIIDMGSSFGLDLSSIASQAGQLTSDENAGSTPQSGIPPEMQEAETAIVAMIPGKAQKYTQQGVSLVNGAEEASEGNYGGMISAAQGIIDDLPDTAIRQGVDDVLHVAETAALGATIGGTLGPYGAAAGAIIGAIVGIVQDIIGLGPPVTQGDMRPSSARMVFPSVPKGTAYSVVPGAANRNPRDQSDSIFYTLDGVPLSAGGPNITNQAIAEDFTVGITWIHPPKSTAATKNQAWLLAQVYLGTDDVTLAHALNPNGPNKGKLQPLAQNVQEAVQSLTTSLGGPTLLQFMIKRVEQWYGSRKGWSTILPSSLTLPMTKTDDKNPKNAAAPFQPARMAFFQTHSLDSLYYPQYASWDGANYNPTDIPNATDIFLCADPTFLLECECAILKYNDLAMLHMLMGKAWLWNRGLEQDKVKTPGMDMSKHRNLMRCIGLLHERVKNTVRMHKRIKNKAIASFSYENGQTQKRNPLQIPARGATIESSRSTSDQSVNGVPMFSMSDSHVAWSEGALSLIRKSQGIPNFGDDPTMTNNGDGTGTFHNNPDNAVVLPAAQATEINADHSLGSTSTLDAAAMGALAGTVLGPVGTLVGGALGAGAKLAYDAYNAGQPSEVVHQSYPINPDPVPSAPLTDDQANHALGAALAAGQAKQKLGQVPMPSPSLTPNGKAAQTIVQGLSSKGKTPAAPDAVKQAVLNQLPPDSMPGVQAGIASLGNNGFLLGILAVGGTMGAYALYEKSRKEQGVKRGL